MTTKEKFNVYQHVTDEILKHLENGVVPWRRPWSGKEAGFLLPLRHEGTPYQGINTLLLWLAANQKEYHSPRWMTYRQAKALGANVKKDEKSTTVVKYGTYDKPDDSNPDKDPEKRGYARAYRVFNAEQIEGLDASFYVVPEPAKDFGTQMDPAINNWFQKMGVPIDITEKPQAYYQKSVDRIHMPPCETFYTERDYTSTLAHEMAHATMHPTRLNRSHQGSQEHRYALEELVAELAASMVCARLGILNTFENNAAYLASWIAALKDDSRAIIQSASAAQAAANWMFDQAGEPVSCKHLAIAAE